VITAVILVAVLVITLFFMPPVAGQVLLGVFLLIAAWEWSGFFLANSSIARVAFVVLAVALAAAVAQVGASSTIGMIILWGTAAWWLGVSIWLMVGRPGLSAASCALTGLMGLVPAWFAVSTLFACESGAWLFVWVVAIVAAADIGAYFTGRSIGRNKLAPTISPGKTREGLYGGLVCAALVAAGGAALAGGPVWLFGLAGVVIGLVSVVGDLTVSVYKRRADLKDSGWILPGHGGVMDRIDSLVAALPVFALVLTSVAMLADTLCMRF